MRKRDSVSFLFFSARIVCCRNCAPMQFDSGSLKAFLSKCYVGVLFTYFPLKSLFFVIVFIKRWLSKLRLIHRLLFREYISYALLDFYFLFSLRSAAATKIRSRFEFRSFSFFADLPRSSFRAFVPLIYYYCT